MKILVGQHGLTEADILTGRVVKKGYSPYVDEDTGHWFEYDDTTKSYKDTGVSASVPGPTGPQGPTGLQGIKGDKGDDYDDTQLRSDLEKLTVTNAIYANDYTKFIISDSGEEIELVEKKDLDEMGVVVTASSIETALGYTPANTASVLSKSYDATHAGKHLVVNYLGTVEPTTVYDCVSLSDAEPTYIEDDELYEFSVSDIYNVSEISEVGNIILTPAGAYKAEVEDVSENKIYASKVYSITNNSIGAASASEFSSHKSANNPHGITIDKIGAASASAFSSHTSASNPHSISKSTIGLGNVENKSSATIRGELTSSNVTSALGYTPWILNSVDVSVTFNSSGLSSSLINMNSVTGKSTINNIINTVVYGAYAGCTVGVTNGAANAYKISLYSPHLAGQTLTVRIVYNGY